MTLNRVTPSRVVGRFAPTPSGPLHIGSLLAAVGSWLDARDGLCLLRIDDLDVTRCRPEHEHSIRDSLARFGLMYPSPVMRQSERTGVYERAVERLGTVLRLFHCDCTRRDLAADGEPCCVRDCRQRRCDPSASSLRADLTSLSAMRTIDRSLDDIVFDPSIHRDVIVRRRDGLYAYPLATVIDDADQGITDVVRGADLLSSTAWQLGLHQALGIKPPRYLHLPVVVEADGQKLAKSRHAVAIDPERASTQLREVGRWLRQDEPPAEHRSAGEILSWWKERWDPARFAGVATVMVDE